MYEYPYDATFTRRNETMIRFLISLTAVLLFLSVPTFAQIYQYTDKDGVVRFTDDIMKVPEDQRDRVKRHKEIQSSPESQTESAEPIKPVRNKPPSSLKEPEKPDKNDETLKEIKKQIDSLKKELEEEHKALIKEKDQIAADTEKWKIRYNTRKRKSVARGKLKELELQRAEWEKKNQAYEKKKKEIQDLQELLKNSSKGKESAPTKK